MPSHQCTVEDLVNQLFSRYVLVLVESVQTKHEIFHVITTYETVMAKYKTRRTTRFSKDSELYNQKPIFLAIYVKVPRRYGSTVVIGHCIICTELLMRYWSLCFIVDSSGFGFLFIQLSIPVLPLPVSIQVSSVKAPRSRQWY